MPWDRDRASCFMFLYSWLTSKTDTAAAVWLLISTRLLFLGFCGTPYIYGIHYCIIFGVAAEVSNHRLVETLFTVASPATARNIL